MFKIALPPTRQQTGHDPPAGHKAWRVLDKALITIRLPDHGIHLVGIVDTCQRRQLLPAFFRFGGKVFVIHGQKGTCCCLKEDYRFLSITMNNSSNEEVNLITI
jgi:hypothetical protein